MGSILEQGLLISLVGLLLTFTALGTLILVISLLMAIFRPRPAAADGEAPGGDRAAAAQAAPQLDETVVAIATAIRYLRAEDERAAEIGTALRGGPGRWWQPRAEVALPARAAAHNGRHIT
jgi:Na+-transporting methylmalonyl-CoA/oxaloacetate decarboxylase gamma subunit